MCGRYYVDLSELEFYGITECLRARYPDYAFAGGDIFPTQFAPVLSLDQGEITPELYRWGYDNPKGKGVIINARAETVSERGLFRKDFFERRCLIPASGFYEWSPDKRKFSYFRADGKPLYIGGFYGNRNGRNNFMILTKDSKYPVSEVHDRMPVLIDAAEMNDWLYDLSFAGMKIYDKNAPVLSVGE